MVIKGKIRQKPEQRLKHMLIIHHMSKKNNG